MGFCAKRPVLGSLVALAGFLAVCLLNHWLFRQIFQADYFRWYANNGALIALATAAFGAAWGKLDNHTGLISPRPCDYLSASFQVAGLPLYALGTHFRQQHSAHASRWELWGAIPMAIVFLAAAFGWLLFVVPMQYFAYLICGAPVRIALGSRVRIEGRLTERRVEFEEQPRDQPLRPDGWWDASMRDSPVALTNAFVAALLFLVDQALKYFAS